MVKIKKRLLRTAQVARALGKVALTVNNPYKMGKVALRAARGKGVVYPGSAYIGPGNEIKSGGKRATSGADRAAYQHDLDYGKLLDRGVGARRLYTGYSAADSRLMKRVDPTTEAGMAVYLGIGAKKLAWKLGLTGKKIKDRPSKKAAKKKKK